MLFSWRSSLVVILFLLSLPRALSTPGKHQPESTEAPRPELRCVVIGDSLESALQLARTASAAARVHSSLPLFQEPELATALASFFGHTMDRKRLQELGETVAAYARKHDFPAVKINISDVSIHEIHVGTVCLVVTLGRYGAISSEGHRFSNQEDLLRDLGIEPGDDVRLSKLGAALDWVNTNPFRAAEAVLRDAGEGRTRLELSLREQRPYRLVAVYDNRGTVYTGRSRYTAAVHAGDLWGAEHQLYYEFTRTRDPHQYQSHALEYRVPLRWRGYFITEAAYSAVRPDLSGSSYTSAGKNFVGTVRHALHHRLGRWSGELSIGVNFKSIRNDLAFGGAPYLVDGHPFQNFHIHQFSLSESLRRYDARGSWWLALNAHLSPGSMDALNHDAAFARSRTGAVARYGYATFAAQRLTTLPHGLQWYLRTLGQLSTSRLLASEQLWLGGAATLRGYPERAYPGDAAWSATQELRSPAWSYRAKFPRSEQSCQLQLLSFLDAGRSYSRHATANDATEPLLLSAGLGLRVNAGRHFDAAFDYGWPLRRTANATSAPGGRGQIQGRLFF